MGRENLLMVADSERDADMLFAVRMFAPDPFIYLRTGGQTQLVMSDLELDRAREQAPHCRVTPLSRDVKRLSKEGILKPSRAQVIRLLLRSKRMKSVLVPANFPLGLAQDLARLG